jgi:ribosome-associated toxin RatA of RatAB toxin-antitoxin module
MRSAISIDVAAPPTLLFRLARDVERWPALLPHYVSVRVLARHDDGSVSAMLVARRPLIRRLGLGLPVAWRSRSWSEPDACRLRFHHLGGATGGMDVTWRIEPVATGARVTIEHEFSPRFPPWARFIDRFVTRPVAGLTLRTFKGLAEALAGDHDGQSGGPRTAYPLS